MFNVVILHNAKITRKKIVLSLVPKWEMAYLPQKGKRKKKKRCRNLSIYLDPCHQWQV